MDNQERTKIVLEMLDKLINNKDVWSKEEQDVYREKLLELYK